MVHDDDPFPEDEPLEMYGEIEPAIHQGVLCCDCGNECDTEWADVGIGAYEYWGSHGVDVQWVELTPCCESTDWAETTEELVAFWTKKSTDLQDRLYKEQMAAHRVRLRIKTFMCLARKYRDQRNELGFNELPRW